MLVLNLKMMGFFILFGSCELIIFNLLCILLVSMLILLLYLNFNVIRDIFLDEWEVICFRLLIVFSVFFNG